MRDQWPVVNSDGIITGIIDGDLVPTDAVLIDGFYRSGEPIITDGNYGFRAILEVV